jgi:DNA-binding response OmpR family regulator
MKTTLVIVDDSKAIHELVEAALADHDYNLKHAFDGTTGVAMVAAVRPDLVLLDVDMPGIDGFEVCRLLKTDPITAEIGVVFLTAAGSADDRVRGLALSSDDYIVKPFDPRELGLRVQTVLRNLRMSRLLNGAQKEELASADAFRGNPRLNFSQVLQARSQNPWNRTPPAESRESEPSLLPQ